MNTNDIILDGIALSVRQGEQGCVDITADLGLAVNGDDNAQFKTMLEANHAYQGTAGATLALDPDSGHALLRKRMWTTGNQDDEFLPELSVFMDKAREWREKLSEQSNSDISNLSLPIV